MKLKLYSISLAIICVAVFSWSCEKDEVDQTTPEPTATDNTGAQGSNGTICLCFLAEYEGAALEFTPTEYVNVSNYRVRMEALEYYVSQLELIDAQNNVVPVSDIEYIDFADGETDCMLVTVPAGTYTQFNMGVGVPASTNVGHDPSVYASDHPLSITNNMHWGWSTGYIFLKLEGKSDTSDTGTGLFNQPFVYHTGADTLYRPLNFQGLSIDVFDGQNTDVNVKLHVDKMFYSASDTLDLKFEETTHTANDLPLAIRFSDILTQAFTIQ